MQSSNVLRYNKYLFSGFINIIPSELYPPSDNKPLYAPCLSQNPLMYLHLITYYTNAFTGEIIVVA